MPERTRRQIWQRRTRRCGAWANALRAATFLAVVEKAAESGCLVLLPDGSRRLWSDPDELYQLLEDTISEYLRSGDELRGSFSDAMKLRRLQRARLPKITPAERAVCCGVQALVDAGDPQPVKRFKQQLRARQLSEQSKQDESMRAVVELHTDRSLYAFIERWRAQVAETERLRQRLQALIERTASTPQQNRLRG